MSAQYTPGPWQISGEISAFVDQLEFKPYRQVERKRPGSSIWETLKDANGKPARFYSIEETRDAIAKATGSNA